MFFFTMNLGFPVGIAGHQQVGAGAGAAVGTATGRMTATTIRCR